MPKILAFLLLLLTPGMGVLAGDLSLSQHLYRDNLSFGYSTSNWDYREVSTKSNEQIMKDSGQLSGGTIKYTHFGILHSVYFTTELMYLSGNTTYDGQYTSGKPVSIRTKNNISHLSLGVGKAFDLEGINSVLSFSASIKSRTLNNENSGVQGDYSRKINYYLLPLQSSLNIITSSGNIIGFSGSYEHFISGRVDSRLSEAIQNHPDVVNFQNKGQIWKIEANYTIVGSEMSFTISPYLKIIKIEDSDKAQVDLLDDSGQVLETRYYYEPANETKMTGLNISLNF